MTRYNVQKNDTQLPPEQRRIPRSSNIVSREKAQQVTEEKTETQKMSAQQNVLSPTKNSAQKQKHHTSVHTDALFYTRKILGEAINEGASDVHFEPKGDHYRVRFRVDGVLQARDERGIDEYNKILNSIKVLGDMDIAENVIPQDGHIELVHEKASNSEDKEEVGKLFDIRVSIFPSVNGEVIVMRILNRENALLTIEELGMDSKTLEKLTEILLTSYGMILVTGPTGAGKTTTLYSVLNELRDEERNIITLEDPIEFHLDWLRQCEIREKRGFTFERAMESVLRQDPDVLMVGEIRDGKTAEHAVRSALAGRIVGSTIHANTTIGTIARLVELGVSRRIVGHTLNGIIAQRLVRKICEQCKTEYDPPIKLRKHFGLEKIQQPFYKGIGCKACNNTGYKGRTGIFSLMAVDNYIRNLLFDEQPLIEIQNYAIKNGMKTLKEDAAQKILRGVTTIEEASRVI
jgi:type II secretory ATPase GspE/PulE/Tfp pilus assembly ATPase PilB-like protein